MSSLEESIKEQAQRLENVQQRLIELLRTGLSDELRSTARRWIETTKLAERLPNITRAIQLRDASKTILLSVETEGVEPSVLCDDVQIVLCGNSLSLECARHIVLTAYVTHTWAHLDILSNVAGRIIGSVKVAENLYPRNNTKLYEGFLKKSNRQVNAFSLDGLIRDGYGEYICASYDIRNAILHDGGLVGTRQLLSMDLATKAFNVDKSMAAKLNGRIHKKFLDAVGGDVDFANVNRFEFDEGDVRRQLVLVDEKLAELIDKLLEWGVNSFESQVRTFVRN